MDKITGYAVLHQDTGRTWGLHIMVGRCKSVLLQVLGPAPQVHLVVVHKFPEVAHMAPSLIGGGWGMIRLATPYICPLKNLLACVCLHFTDKQNSDKHSIDSL